MEQLRELEKRVLDIIEKNKELRKNNERLEAENKELRAQNGKYETAMQEKKDNADALAKERSALKNTICELIESIDSLQATK